MINLSVTITTFNEEINIQECIKSVLWADEIVIVDSGSNDKTIEIAKQYTDKIYSINNYSNLNIKKNYAFEKASKEWIFFLDADERCTEALKNEILCKIKNVDKDGYLVPRKNYFLNKWIKHCGWYPDYQVKLFKKAKGKFDAIHVHERLRVNGSIGYIQEPYLHFTYPTLDLYLQKLNFYTTFESEYLFKEMSKDHKNWLWKLLVSSQDRKPILRYIYWKYIPFKPFIRFFLMYIIKKGFLDGKEGFILSVLSAFSDYISLVKYYQISNNNNSI